MPKLRAHHSSAPEMASSVVFVQRKNQSRVERVEIAGGDVPVATLQERVAQRGREAERDGADGGGGGVSADYLRTLDVAHEKYYEQLGHPKARVDGTPPTDDVVAAVVAAERRGRR